jgi:prepilin-type N-terminal cleavage/methylation domain-containing protein
LEAKVKHKGFSMIEMLVVIAVLGILMAIATPNYRRWRASVQVNQMAEQFVQEINKQRSEAKRTNSTRSISFATNSYTSTSTMTMPSTIVFEAVSSTANLSFQSPYGTSNEPLRTFKFRWANDPSIERTVRVVGVMAKVIVQ